jgi:hypothetical protein
MDERLRQSKDHGVWSALMLAHLLAIRQGFASRERGGLYGDFSSIHVPACHAICLHNLETITVEFERYPLAFLLILCDELQDWGRHVSRSHEHQQAIKLVDIDVNMSMTHGSRFVFKIHAVVDASQERIETLNGTLKKRLKHPDEIEDRRMELLIENTKGHEVYSL